MQLHRLQHIRSSENAGCDDVNVIATTTLGGSSHFIARGVCKGECSDGNETNNEQDMDGDLLVGRYVTVTTRPAAPVGIQVELEHGMLNETALDNQRDKRP
jgi:hypothetical protein